MAVYRVHPGGMGTSMPPISRKRQMVRMFMAVDRHTNFQYTDTISAFCAVSNFDLAIVERLNGNRLATMKYLATSLSSGRLQLAGRWRALMSLLAYCLFGIR